jgi:CHAT domain-containing protein
VEADKIYCEMRRERSISKPSNSVGAQQILADSVEHDFIYSNALQITLEAYRKPGQHSMVNVQTCTGDSLDAHLVDFLEWTQKCKARGLTDALGLEARLPSGMLAEAKQSSKASALLDKEIQLVSEISIPGFEKNLHLRSQLRELRETMRAEPALDQIMRIRDGSSMTLSEIQMLGVELGPNVVFVDWICVGSINLVMVLYRNGLFWEEIFLHIKLEEVEHWVYEQLDVINPLGDSSATSKLSTLAGLIAPLERYTCPGDTLVLCPTRILHRVPLHAIKLGDQPLIARNPVVYTQSLSILRLCHMSLKSNPPPTVTATPPSFRAVVIHPLPDSWLSTNQVKELTANLGATALHGPHIDRSSFFATAANASLIHYHGHVSSNSQPLYRALTLDATSQEFSEETSIAVDAIFDLPLAKPALVTLIGCSSNHAPINQTDDLRSIPSAFHYAGASSVVSTLWPIRDADGAKFSQAFYSALGYQMEKMESAHEQSSVGKLTLDLAKAIQEAVSMMMTDDEGTEQEAYHWAGYVLNGVWRWEVPRGALANL